MALNIFSVSSISASRVALHLPSSSALRSTFEDLPIFASSALYCTSSLASSSFLSLRSCSRLASQFSKRDFSSLCTFLSCSVSLLFSAYNSTRTSSRVCTFSRLEMFWSWRMLTLATRSALRSRSSSSHHSLRKALRARISSLASLWACSSLLSSSCSSWWAASSSVSLPSSSWMLRLSQNTRRLRSEISLLRAFCSEALVFSNFLTFYRFSYRSRLISSSRCVIQPFLSASWACRISNSVFLFWMAVCRSSSLLLASSSICFIDVVQFRRLSSRSAYRLSIFWLSICTECSWSRDSSLCLPSRCTFSEFNSSISLRCSAISRLSLSVLALWASLASSHSSLAFARFSAYCFLSRSIVSQSSSSFSRWMVKILSSSLATRVLRLFSEFSWSYSCVRSQAIRNFISSFFLARVVFRLLISSSRVSSTSWASRRRLATRDSVSVMRSWRA